MEWRPTPGDRVRTVITKDHKNEIIYLNADHAIESTFTDEFILITGEHIPWAHQIIDYLSNRRDCNRALVLKKLIEFEALHRELDFDELCLLFFEQVKNEEAKYFSLGGNNDTCIHENPTGQIP